MSCMQVAALKLGGSAFPSSFLTASRIHRHLPQNATKFVKCRKLHWQNSALLSADTARHKSERDKGTSLHFGNAGQARPPGPSRVAQEGSQRAICEVDIQVEARLQKKKVALWLGYAGSAYNGSQLQRNQEGVVGVENVLEDALLAAGRILPSNYGDLTKLGWSRSSRTDKGVHSLATVVSCKLEIPAGSFETDPEGIAIAESINKHLPPDIRVFGAVPVTRSFHAQHSCKSRAYEYLLPAPMLGINSHTSLSEIQRIIGGLRSILACYVGTHPFHNFTTRRFYRPSLQKPSQANSSVDLADSTTEQPDSQHPGVSDSTDEETGSEEEVGGQEGKDEGWRRAYWLRQTDMADLVGPAHNRRIQECTCGELETVGSLQFVRIRLQGDSFMLNQIRKMVGLAVAMIQGTLPLEILEPALQKHARVIIPTAPAEGLFLLDSEFHPFNSPERHLRFRVGWSVPLSESNVRVACADWWLVVVQADGRRLEMSVRALERRDAFRREKLLPVMLPLLQAEQPPWCDWQENTREVHSIPQEELNEFLSAFAQWRANAPVRSAERPPTERRVFARSRKQLRR